MTLATISFLCPLAMVLKKPQNVVTVLYLASFITLGAITFSPLGRQIDRYING